MHQIQTALFQGHFVSSNEEIFLYLWVSNYSSQKKGCFSKLDSSCEHSTRNVSEKSELPFTSM